jgi:hypothetical protein
MYYISFYFDEHMILRILQLGIFLVILFLMFAFPPWGGEKGHQEILFVCVDTWAVIGKHHRRGDIIGGTHN